MTTPLKNIGSTSFDYFETKDGRRINQRRISIENIKDVEKRVSKDRTPTPHPYPTKQAFYNICIKCGFEWESSKEDVQKKTVTKCWDCYAKNKLNV